MDELKRLAAIFILVVAAAGCGSGTADHTTTQSTGGSLNQIGSYDGYQIHEFNAGDADCIFVENSYDNNIGLSCHWPTDTTTTTTTPFGG
jgi:hypothetical protein